VVRVGPEAAVLAYDHHEGTALAERNPGCSDAELSQIWDAVGRLHAHKVTHRGLTADRILLTDDGQAMLLDPGDGDIAASDLQIRLDVAQLIAELALAVGPDRAADLAVEKMSADDLVAVVSLLQPVALARPTRKRCAAAATCCPRCAPGCSRRCRAARSPRPGWSASGRAPC